MERYSIDAQNMRCVAVAEKFMERLLVLIQEDDELHEALVDLIKAQTRAAQALADWRDRRK